MGQARVRRVQTFKGALEAPQARSPSRWSSDQDVSVLRGGGSFRRAYVIYMQDMLNSADNLTTHITAAADGVAATNGKVQLHPSATYPSTRPRWSENLEWERGASGCRTAAPCRAWRRAACSTEGSFYLFPCLLVLDDPRHREVEDMVGPTSAPWAM
jgi:hypothetical protein